MSAALLKKALKDGGRCYVADVDGVPWIGSPHFAVTVGKHASQLLAKANLGPVPAVLDVNGFVTRVPDAQVPNVAKVVADARAETGATVGHLLHHRFPVIVPTESGDCYVLESGEAFSYVRRELLDAIVTELGGDDVAFTQASPLKPLLITGADGGAILMPVRVK